MPTTAAKQVYVDATKCTKECIGKADIRLQVLPVLLQHRHMIVASLVHCITHVIFNKWQGKSGKRHSSYTNAHSRHVEVMGEIIHHKTKAPHWRHPLLHL